jgi:predicted nucleic acid-binding protein
MNAVFVDTMGWFSLLNRRDAWHETARGVMGRLSQEKTPLFTTDYVADETATLLKVRGATHALDSFFELLDTSRALTMTTIGPARFAAARQLFLRRKDQGYSFTDVTSFVVMEELRIREALTHDGHFVAAGFVRLLE